MRFAPIALAAIAILAAACAGNAATSAPADQIRTVSGQSQPGAFGYTTSGQAGPAGPNAIPQPASPADAQKAQAGGNLAIPAAFDPDRMLILTASIAMQGKDPWAAADRAQAVAVGLGGDVVGLSQSGKGDAKTANLTLRVPSARFTEALRQLRDLSDTEVVSSSVDGKDVTEQFVDLDARLKAKQAEESRYLSLLARADKIDDILKIDQSLAQVRTQIEQLTGQLNSIKQRTAFSTITVSITPVPLSPIGPDPKGAYDPSKTVQAAIATLAVLFRVVADLAIWGLVFGWIPLVILAGALFVQRGRRVTTAV